VNRKKRKIPTDDVLDVRMGEDMSDTFAFIAGYTPGGFPYGTTWEELGIDPALPLDEKVKRHEKMADTYANPEKAIDDSESPF